ncbi:MAG: DUF3106 domain-containing protein [Rubrivivax sp.]
MRPLRGLGGRCIHLLLLAGMVGPGAVLAQSKPAAPSTPSVPSSAGQWAWATLTLQQRRDLQPLQKEWASLTADRQQKWLEVAARMPMMSDDERERIRERMTEWARLSPAQRGQARLQFQEARQWPSEDRQARWEAYLALSDDERTAWAGQAQRPHRPTIPEGGKPSVSAPVVQKQNSVVATAQGLSTPKTVAPTVVQIKPGATTLLVSRTNAPPAHHQPGLPKIAATTSFVDPLTLLPRRGPQAAAMAASASEQTSP